MATTAMGRAMAVKAGNRNRCSQKQDWATKLTQTEILDVFTEEVQAVGAEVHGMLLPDKLLACSILPHLAEVRPGDEVSGGVALRATSGTGTARFM